MTLRPLARLTVLTVLIALVVAACGGPATTAAPPAATQAPAATSAPEATAAPAATEAPAPTEEPAAEPVVLRVAALPDDYRQDADDPGRVNIGMGTVNTNIFDQLTRMDSEFNVQPMLAESWEYMADSGTWRFHLRQDATFHNGQPFTAEAVVEDMQRVAGGEYAPILRIDENSAVAMDDYTVDITPTSPNLQLPASIAHPIFGIPAPGTNLLEEQIGTGPFMMVEYVKDDHLTVARNPDYWGTVPQVDQIEFRFFPDPNTRALALQAGEVDLIYDVPRESAAELIGLPGIQVLNANVSAYQAIGVMLTGDNPYDITADALVREAIGYAIDRQAIIDGAFGGFATVSQTFIPAPILGQYASQVVGYTYDPDQAMALLEEAGWTDSDGDGIRDKDGRPLALEMVSGFPDAAANGMTPEVVQAQLLEVGIDMSIVAMPDDPAYEARLEAKEGDLWMEIGNQNVPAPCFLPSFLYYGKDPAPNIWEIAFAPAAVGYPEFDDEIDACNAAATQDDGRMHAGNAIHLLVDEARAVIPLVGVFRIWAAGDQVQGFDPHPVFVHVRWEGVSLSQ